MNGEVKLRSRPHADAQSCDPDSRQPLHEGGFQYEAAEVARCVAAGRLESETLPWAETLAVLETMDEVRRQLGVTYPGE